MLSSLKKKTALEKAAERTTGPLAEGPSNYVVCTGRLLLKLSLPVQTKRPYQKAGPLPTKNSLEKLLVYSTSFFALLKTLQDEVPSDFRTTVLSLLSSVM